METITIYHTNDVHSHFENWPRIQRFLSERKKSHKEKGDEVFLFDIGDFVDLWHPYSEATKGKGNIQLLNECGYTAVTIGNNEGITLSNRDLDDLYADADFDVIVANLYKEDQTYPAWAVPFKLYETKKGSRIGVIGLTAYFSTLFHLLGWRLTEPLPELKKQIAALKEEADVLILLSHLGIDCDEQIAAECPEIDVILGGHTHHTLEKGRLVNKTLLAAAGKYGYFAGKVTLEISQQKKVANKEAVLMDVNKLPAALNEKEIKTALFQKGKEMLGQKITFLAEPLESHYLQETKLSKMLVEALREWCGADCAFLNAGLLLGPLSGEVTAFDLLQICPHPINPCKLELSGKQLHNVLLQTRNKKWLNKKITGFGFRGTVMGTFIYSQILFKNDDGIEIDGRELDPFRIYSLAVPDMFTFARFFKELNQCPEKKYYLPEFLRDLLKWKLQKD